MNPDGYQYTFTRAAVAQEPARQRRRRADDDPDGVDPNRNYRSTSSTTRRAPRRSSRARPTAARAAARSPRRRPSGPVEARPVRLQRQLPLRRRVAAVPGGLAGRLPDGRRPDLLRAVGQPRPAGDRGLSPGPELGRPLRHQRRGQRLPAQAWAGRWRGPRSSPRAARAAASCSPTTRRSSRRSSSATCRSPSPSRSPRRTRTTRSPLGIKTKPFYIRATTRTRTGIPGANFAFKYSYGDPQPVQVLAKRALGAVTVKYRSTAAATRSASTSEWRGGERYKPAAVTTASCAAP